jgi:hypothetical protein
MAAMQAELADLDSLIENLESALADQNWGELSQLNGQIKAAVEPLMLALKAGQIDATPIHNRLERLHRFVDAADKSAKLARKEAQEALNEVNRNRSAAKAYQTISSGRSK